MLPTSFRVIPALLFCVVAALGQTDAARLYKLFDDDHAWRLQNSPESASYDGYPGYNDRWTDYSPAAIAKRNQHPAEELRVLDSINRANLSESDRLNYDLFRWRTEREAEESRFPEQYLNMLDPLGGGVQTWVPMTLQHAPNQTVKDYEDMLARLRKTPALVEQAMAVLREGLAKGITQPRIVLRDIPSQVDRILKDAPADSVFLKSFREFPTSIAPAEQGRLRREAAALVDGPVYASFRKYRDFLAQDYIPQCRETIGLSALPDGQAWYRERTLRMNTTHLTPQEIHEIGLGEVKRIHAEMDKVIASAGFHGSFAEWVKFLRNDPRFYYTNAADLVTGYRDICKRVDAQLPRLFGKLPRTPYGVEEIAAYYAPSQTTAFYEPGPVDGSRSGTYRVNTYKLESRPKYEMEVLSMHESVPGHHLQIALAHELEGLPEFRKDLETTAFVEGWGLYSESLGYEMGFYKDPYSRFGQLSYDMWRACRLVVDTGMHALGWSRQQAIDYMKENSGLTEQNIVVEVDRYIAWPGQATAYKIGQLKIRELRTLAEQRLGAKFDERRFHDRVLGAGALPLEVLDRRVKEWIEKESAL